jgi:cyclohexyl-isocyanide hydratase
MDRRDFNHRMAAALASALAAGQLAAQTQPSGGPPASADKPAANPDHDMSKFPASWTGKEQIAMLVYPGFTALDLAGPQYMFGSLMGATVHIVAKTLEPVKSDTGLVVMPSITFDECPKELDFIFAPGGTQGTLDAIKDDATMAFMADRGSRAKYVTSVCTGSLLIGAAGLLKGYRATSHWATHDLLPQVGAIPVKARVVRDRNRITGAGVTAGIDFGLQILEMQRDREYAQSIQLIAEYAPAPHLNAGTTRTAPRKVTSMMREMFSGFTRTASRTLKDAMSRPPPRT